jgi:bacterioferritin-associated ferredoxin
MSPGPPRLVWRLSGSDTEVVQIGTAPRRNLLEARWTVEIREYAAVYVCICFAVSESELADVIAAGARTEEAVGDTCGAGAGCGNCRDRICDQLRAADVLPEMVAAV